MEDRSTICCPLCGNKVPRVFTKCPVCATDLQHLVSRKPEAFPPQAKGDYLRVEIPKVELPQTRHLCPLCAIDLTGKETKCPRCGIPLVSEESMLECPECGAIARAGSRSCPKCGIEFGEKPEVPRPPLEEILPPPSPPSPIRKPAESVSEAVTTVAPVPQTVTRDGLVNGRGAINGTGFVNGTGMINGTRAEGRLSVSARRQKMFLTRWQVLAVLVALVIVLPTFIYLSYSRGPAGISIDGDFGDWSDVVKHGMRISSASSAINIEEWAVQADSAILYFYLRVQGQLMASSDVNSFYLFVDSDNQPSTGYAVSGIGADYLIQLHGWNGSVQAASVEEFSSSGGDQYNWNAWDSIGSASSAKSSNALEGMAQLPVSLSSASRLVLVCQDNLERRAVSYTVPARGGVLVIEQEPGPGIQSAGIVPSSSSVSVLRLKLTGEGSSGTVTGIAPMVLGATPASTIGPISLDAGETQIVDVMIDTSLSAPGSLVTCFVTSSDVTSSYSQLLIIGDPVRAYVSSPPASIQIDGAFGDWEGRTTVDSDYIGNMNIDVSEVGAVNDSATSSFYVMVEGQMCGGTFVPMLKMKPSGGGGGGGIIIPSRKTGEDVLRIYIDSDLSATTGYPLSLASKAIGADYAIEVRGLNGRIVAKSLTEYAAGQWTRVSSTVNAANDVRRIEVGISSESIGGSSSIDFIVETTDWSGRKDLATAVPQGEHVLTTGVLSAIDPMRWIVDGSTTSSVATAMSYQRKIFYDGVNYWSFYFDGSNTVCKYSKDMGQTWISGGRVFKTAGVNEVSVWYDQTNNVAYAVGDTATASRNVYVQKGTVSPATSSIAWAGSDSSLVVSERNLPGKNAFICRDASGYIWVLSSNMTQATPNRYDLSAFRSRAVNDITSWSYSGNMLDTDDAQPNIKGVIVPAGSGSDVWAVYTYSGNVASRKYTGTWSPYSDIYLIGGGNPGNTDNAPPSAVVDARGVIHVVYGDGHQQAAISKPFIYYVYNASSRWSVPYRLDSASNANGCFHPTISLDASTGNIHAFWIHRIFAPPTDSWMIEGKKNVSGAWSSIPIANPDTASPKQHLTSAYSVPGENYVCWQWTQNLTGTIQVIFDRIPEFNQVLIPIFFVVLLFVALYRTRSARKKG